MTSRYELWQIEEVLAAQPLARATQYATERQSWCNSDGGHGVTYPEDLDEYEREVEGAAIEAGYVLLFGRTNVPRSSRASAFEVCLPECIYLDVLANKLEANGSTEESENIRKLSREAQQLLAAGRPAAGA
jgi:hypothetical protein